MEGDDEDWPEPEPLTELQEAAFVLNMLADNDPEFADRADAEWMRLQATGLTADEATLALMGMAAEKLREISATAVACDADQLQAWLGPIEGEA